MAKVLLLALKSGKNESVFYNKSLFEFKSRSKLWNTPHLGLLTVGAMLPPDVTVEYLDLNYEDCNDYQYDWVFMSPTTSQAPDAYQYADKFRKRGTKVAIGGPHATMLPKEAAPHADAVFCGEAEGFLPDFLSCSAINSAAAWPDLKKTPVPLYALAKKYAYSSIPVQTSRGCPHQCSFCLSSKIYGKAVRHKDISQVKAELFYIKSQYKQPFIFFVDDNFLIDEGYSLQVLSVLKELRLLWYAFTDISIYQKPNLLYNLHQAGCRKLLIGFESLSELNLKKVNKSGFKSSKIQKYKEAIQTIQAQKIGVIGSFVLGLKYDTEETFEELYQFILDTKLYGTNITVATPFPGTDFYADMHGRKLSDDWRDYDGFTLVFEHPSFDRRHFEEKFSELILKINSKQRIQTVLTHFQKIMKG